MHTWTDVTICILFTTLCTQLSLNRTILYRINSTNDRIVLLDIWTAHMPEHSYICPYRKLVLSLANVVAKLLHIYIMSLLWLTYYTVFRSVHAFCRTRHCYGQTHTHNRPHHNMHSKTQITTVVTVVALAVTCIRVCKRPRNYSACATAITAVFDRRRLLRLRKI